MDSAVFGYIRVSQAEERAGWPPSAGSSTVTG